MIAAKVFLAATPTILAIFLLGATVYCNLNNEKFSAFDLVVAVYVFLSALYLTFRMVGVL